MRKQGTTPRGTKSAPRIILEELRKLPQSNLQGTIVPTRRASIISQVPSPLRTTMKDAAAAHRPIGVIGGGVSGIFAALTLVELGYRNVTIIERDTRLGGKAGSFSYRGEYFPIGAVSTPFALRESSFTGAQIFEQPLKFAASVARYSRHKLQILNANNVFDGKLTPIDRPRAFEASELAGEAKSAWEQVFGPSGKPDRFYAHNVDFSAKSDLAAPAFPKLLPAWGKTTSSWPLIYVSAHGYGVARSRDSPPYYYWTRFAQKSTNAAKLAALGPRGPALKGFDTTGHLEDG